MTEFRTLKPFTFQGLIDHLATLGDEPVRGLGYNVHSYRGYYDRPAITPEPEQEWPASTLVEWYTQDIGKTLYGWKGGEYPLRAIQWVYYAEDGDTGPYITGFESINGAYQPILVEEAW